MSNTHEHDISADELAEFQRGVDALDPVNRRILALLIPRLIAMEEEGDTEGALIVIDRIKLILWEGRRTRH
jgi:hypothetical protein